MAVSREVDRGFAWMILFVSWLQLVIADAMFYSVSVVNTAVLEEFQEGVTRTSWVGSTMLGMILLTGPVISSVTDLLGCRLASILGGLFVMGGMVAGSFAPSVNLLIVSYSLFVGIGVGFLETAAFVATGHYFDKYRPLAAGIQSSGAGWGMLGGAPLARFLLDSFGLSGMFLILGGVGFQACVCGMIMRPSPYETQKRMSNESEGKDNGKIQKRSLAAIKSRVVSSLVTIIKEFRIVLCTGGFLFYIIAFTVSAFGESAFHVHLTNYVEQKGTSPKQSAMLFTAMGVTSMISRMLAGFAGNDPAVSTLLLHSGMLGLAGVLFMLFPAGSTHYLGQVIMAALFGLYTGGPTALFNPNAVQLVGIKHLAAGYGVKNLICGIGILLGPPFAGFVLEYSGSYDTSFICSGAAVIIASLMSLLVPMFKKNPDATSCTHADVELTVKDPVDIEYKETLDPLLHLPGSPDDIVVQVKDPVDTGFNDAMDPLLYPSGPSEENQGKGPVDTGYNDVMNPLLHPSGPSEENKGKDPVDIEP